MAMLMPGSIVMKHCSFHNKLTCAVHDDVELSSDESDGDSNDSGEEDEEVALERLMR